MNRKIIIATLSLFALPAFATPPQEMANNAGNNKQQHSHEQQRKASRDVMKEVLSLRDNQTAAVAEILKAEYVSMRELKRQGQSARREQREAMHKQTISKLSTILDEQQLAQFKAFRTGMQLARHLRNNEARSNSEQ